MAPRSRVRPRAWLHATVANVVIDHWRNLVWLALALAMALFIAGLTGAAS